jgi:DNA-binding LytR/AlgR family response regulator
MVLKNKRQEVLDVPLAKIEIMLPEGTFCRVHRSFLVNTVAITAFRYYRNQLLAIAHGCRLPVSRRRGKIIMESLDVF